MRATIQRGFTLVEILIVVVILAILAVLTVPRMLSATDESATNATLTDLHKIRNHVTVYRARNNVNPPVTQGNGTWGPLIGRDYLAAPPTNAWVGGSNSRVIVFGTAPDTVYHTNYGWIYDPATGNVWAASMDGNDEPLPR